MGKYREIEKEFIMRLAVVVQNKDFIISSLRLMDDDSKKNEIIEYLKKHPNVTKKELESKMFYMTIHKKR